MANEDASKLFVAGLPDSVTEDVLRRLFEATGGTVVSVSLPKDRATGRPRGFGFVTLGSSQEAASARSALDGSVQAGRAISVRPFQSEPPRRGEGRAGGDAPSAAGSGASEDRTLYVGNLPYDVTQQELEALFSEHGAGPIVRIHLPVGPDGRPRGFGFVSLASSEAANQAISALRDVEVRGRRLMINIANPRGSGPPAGGGFRGGPPRGPRPMHDEPPLEPRAPDRHEAKARFGEPDEGEEGPSGEGKPARTAGGGKKKKEKEKGKPSKRERGGGGSWQKWTDWDED